ncbi:hypothetical protein CVT25_001280 [Psilocybe cyanescens]|uniref:Uncharacterized protein n=1 Tax=Psilocybe cyanescens TaxID=93625 RepID=A0A409XEP7_PSICY|nr:hypothetical protein CVT25_001280 [Psilocybe cyanescens]
MPPDSLTCTLPLYLTVSHTRRTSSLVAPLPDANPVEVLTNAVPAFAARTQAAILNSGLGTNPVSMMTFTGTGDDADMMVFRRLYISRYWITSERTQEQFDRDDGVYFDRSVFNDFLCFTVVIPGSGID